jgi:hypothetical protein
LKVWCERSRYPTSGAESRARYGAPADLLPNENQGHLRSLAFQPRRLSHGRHLLLDTTSVRGNDHTKRLGLILHLSDEFMATRRVRREKLRAERGQAITVRTQVGGRI